MTRWDSGDPGHVAEHNLIAVHRFNVKDAKWAGGAKGNGTTDDTAAFAAVRDAIDQLSTNSQNYGPLVEIPYGRYRLSEPQRFARGSVIQGASGFGRGAGSVLVMDDGVTGIRIDNTTTSEDGGTGQWSVIRDLGIAAQGKTTPGAHGLLMYARAKAENVYISGFSGDGVHIAGGTASGPDGEATNVNNWQLESMRVQSCGGHGVYVNGGDSNAGTAINVDASSNIGWGIWDSSFLGNCWIACHTSNNGQNAQVSHNGSRYYLAPANEALGGSTEPGTDESVWVHLNDEGVHAAYPAWVEGHAYTQGGAYRMDGTAALGASFVSCYSEGGQPASDISHPAMVWGGDHGAGFTPTTRAFVLVGSIEGGRLLSRSTTAHHIEGRIFGEGDARWKIRGDGRLRWYEGTNPNTELGHVGPDGIRVQSPDGTLYELTPPNGGGAATWTAV